jgi:hypothetical protein
MRVFVYNESIIYPASCIITCMGILGIIVTVAVMVFGVGYLLSGSLISNFTVENPAAEEQGTGNRELAHNSSSSDSGRQGTTENRLSVGMEALEKAKEVSQQTTENSQQLADSIDKETADNGQGTGSSQNPQSAILNQKSKIAVKDRLVSFGYAESPGRTIDTVVLHSSYNNQGGDRYSVDKVIDIWKSYEVAPHYMIDRKGNILRLVEDQDIAYHAGNSKMPDGRTNVNGFSIGIEILNAEDDEYATVQYEAVNDLVAYLKREHGVKYVVGHDDIAPGRKTDPWNFDWKKLK